MTTPTKPASSTPTSKDLLIQFLTEPDDDKAQKILDQLEGNSGFQGSQTDVSTGPQSTGFGIY